MNLSNKTFLPTNRYKNSNWFVIDCDGQKLGRLATLVATLLKGKLKPHYNPAIDTGDYIILINVDSIILNEQSKHYFVYNPGRPGTSLKTCKVSDCLTKITVERAIKGMLPRAETKKLMRRLNIYSNNQHPHMAQQPIKLDLSSYPSDSKFNTSTIHQKL